MKTPKQGHSCFEGNRGTCLSLFFRCCLKGESKCQGKEFNHGHCHSYTGYGPAKSYLAQLRHSVDSLRTRIISLQMSLTGTVMLLPCPQHAHIGPG